MSRLVSVPVFVLVGFFIAVTVYGAARILGLWRRTRQLPELLIAIVMLGIGALGVGLSYLTTVLVPVGPLQNALAFVPMLGVHIGVGALWAFTWRVYHPESPVARGVVYAAWAVLAGLWLLAAAGGSARALQAPPLHTWTTSVYVGAMAWSAVESSRYWVAMRNRLRLGLADALTTHRFLLWGAATGCAATGTTIGAVAQRLAPAAEGTAHPGVMLCYAGFGLAAAVCFWLAFLPPQAYRDRIARGGAAAAS